MDMVDRAANEIEHYLSVKLANIQQQHSEVDDKITERYCVDCGELIPQERLKAIPGAIRCVSCQEAFEQHKC